MNRIAQHANEVSHQAFGDIRRATPMVNKAEAPVSCLGKIAAGLVGAQVVTQAIGGKNS